jgi:hypothetical protein
MIIKPKRLLSLLAPSGFQLDYVSDVAQKVVFWRSSGHSDLREFISIHCAGRNGELVPAEIGISVVRERMAISGLVERKVLVEAADQPQTGQSRLKSREEAIRWEQRLADIAPERAASLSRRSAGYLLAGTEQLRRLSQQYVSLAGPVSGVTECERQLRLRASPSQRSEADRLAEWPGVMWVPGAEVVYGAATLALMVFGEEVEHCPRPFAGLDPLEHLSLNQRIQLIAHLLMEHDDRFQLR